MQVNKILSAILRNPIDHHKRVLDINNNQMKIRLSVHYNHLNKWIESTINNPNANYLDERIELIRNEIDRFENLYPEPNFKVLSEQMEIKFKQLVRKANFNSVVNILVNHSFKSKKLDVKKLTGLMDDSFINMFITHKITILKNGTKKENLIIQYIANDPFESKKLIFDFPYNKQNNELPDLERLNNIFTSILNNFKIKITYKPIDYLIG
jgi:hypothetical protein